MPDKMNPPPTPRGIASDVVIITKDELAKYGQDCWLAGIARGRWEEYTDSIHSKAQEVSQGDEGHIERGGSTDDAALVDDQQARPVT